METTTTTTAVPPLELTRAPRKTPSLDLRDIPQAPGPEKGVLALMAMDPATYVGQCVTIGMTEDYFYLPAHKLLWRLFQARYNKNEPIDIVSITQALEDMHQLEAVGGSAGLAEIYTFTTTGAYFEHYLNVLKDKFILRSIIDIANQSTTQAFDNPDDVAELLDSVETHIFQIRERYNSAKDEQSLASILKQAVTNFEKFIASKGQIQGLTTGFEELDKKSNGLKPGVKEVGASQLVIDDTAAISINELRAKARRVMRDQGGLAAIGVDYLQLMRSHSKQAANSREREVAEISAGLKALAKELKVPVIVLAQLNRGPESRTGASLGVPRISDLRESGSIEQDADMIGLLYRSAYYAEDEEKRQQMAGRANLHLAKNRNGPTGDVPLHFEAELMRFSTREADEHDQESE